MEINKITEKYTFYKEQDYWVLNLGKIVNGEDTSTTLRITDVDAYSVHIQNTCGCTSNTFTIIDPQTLDIAVNYNQCDSEFAKVLVVTHNGIQTLLKVTGTCQ